MLKKLKEKIKQFIIEVVADGIRRGVDQPKDSRMEMYRRLAPAAWKEQVDELIAERRNPSK